MKQGQLTLEPLFNQKQRLLYPNETNKLFAYKQRRTLYQDGHYNYYPSYNPKSIGLYSWIIIFLRNYGNTLFPTFPENRAPLGEVVSFLLSKKEKHGKPKKKGLQQR